jgi:hypothetical protein
MNDATADHITLQVTLTRDDYARYAVVLSRRESDWIAWATYLGTWSAAIPVAVAFRSFASDAQSANLVGKCSLFGFLLGIVTMLVANAIRRRFIMRAFLAGTVNPLEPRQIVFDAAGVTTAGRIYQAKWRWSAIDQVTAEKGLLLLWIGRTAVVIPERSFASPAARAAAIACLRAWLPDAASGSSSAAA